MVSEEAAVISLATIFPAASPTFLRWAVSYHTTILKSPLLTLDHVVDAVSEKIRECQTSPGNRAHPTAAHADGCLWAWVFAVDGLGTLYPRKGRGPSTEEGDIWRINQDL